MVFLKISQNLQKNNGIWSTSLKIFYAKEAKSLHIMINFFFF